MPIPRGLDLEVHYDVVVPHTAGGRRPPLAKEARVLVVPFAMNAEYYERGARRVMRHLSGEDSITIVREHVHILPLYPGAMPGGVLVRKIERYLGAARAQGKPFTGVVLEALHNVPLAYQTLADDWALWPSLYALLRSVGVTTISTFTSFDVGVRGGSWAEMLEPAKVSRVLSQLLTAQADATVFFDLYRGKVLARVPLGVAMVPPPDVAFEWNTRDLTFSSAAFVLPPDSDGTASRSESVPRRSTGRRMPRRRDAE